MRILLTGHLGQLATDLKPLLAGEELILSEIEDLPLENAARVMERVSAARPEMIVNCAAYNRVDEAEDNPEAAFAANAFGPRHLALAARAVGAVMVHFSTDYVFDGDRRAPYTEADLPCPRSVYGVSKLSGEHMVQATLDRHFIFRVCGLYGYAGSRDKGSNFVETMLALAGNGKPLRVVADQVLTPTSTVDVARAARRVIATDRYGLYHLTSSGACSWYEFARKIFELAGVSPEVVPVETSAFPAKARRPAYSVLDNARLRAAGFEEMPPWEDALKRYLAGRTGRRPAAG